MTKTGAKSSNEYTKTALKDANGRVIHRSKSGEYMVRRKIASGANAGKLTWRKAAARNGGATRLEDLFASSIELLKNYHKTIDADRNYSAFERYALKNTAKTLLEICSDVGCKQENIGNTLKDAVINEGKRSILIEILIACEGMKKLTADGILAEYAERNDIPKHVERREYVEKSEDNARVQYTISENIAAITKLDLDFRKCKRVEFEDYYLKTLDTEHFRFVYSRDYKKYNGDDDMRGRIEVYGKGREAELFSIRSNKGDNVSEREIVSFDAARSHEDNENLDTFLGSDICVLNGSVIRINDFRVLYASPVT